MLGMIAGALPMSGHSNLSPTHSPQTALFVTAFRIVSFLTVFALIFFAMNNALGSLEFGLTLTSIGAACLLTHFVKRDKSRCLQSIAVVHDLTLVVSGALGAAGVIGLSQTVLASMIWVGLPLAVFALAVLVCTVIGASLILCSPRQHEELVEEIGEDFDIFTWSVQQTNEDKAALRKRDNAPGINAGKEFIDTHVRPAIKTHEDQELFDEADSSVMQFIFSKAIFEYSMGSLRHETRLPSFFHADENYVAEEITHLRDVHTAGIIIPDQLTACFSDYKHFKDRDTYLTDHTAQTLMSDIIKVPLLWQKSMLIGDCYQAALASGPVEEDG
jgi:hypothetical protein